MTLDKWINSVVEKQPVYDDKNEAIKAAIQANKKPRAVHAIWKEPEKCGGRYVVASCEAFEALYRGGYEQILDDCMLADIERGDYIGGIEGV